MGLRAPLGVPVEISVELDAGPRRVFRLAASVGEDGVRLVRHAPFEIGRPVRVRFTLPMDESPAPLTLDAEVLHADHDDETRNEDAGGRELTFLHPSAEARRELRGYVRARLDLPS